MKRGQLYVSCPRLRVDKVASATLSSLRETFSSAKWHFAEEKSPPRRQSRRIRIQSCRRLLVCLTSIGMSTVWRGQLYVSCPRFYYKTPFMTRARITSVTSEAAERSITPVGRFDVSTLRTEGSTRPARRSTVTTGL